MPAATRVLVTGATGFVGRTLCGMLAQSGYHVRAAVRSDGNAPPGVAESVVVGDLDAGTDWSKALQGVDCVVHAAARVHVLHDSPSSADLYMQANVRGTRSLAEASAQAGAHRFIYLSSIKVNGEATLNRPFSAIDPPNPVDDYGASKWQAEQALSEVAVRSGMQAVVIRPPLVYGPGVRANFLRLLSSVHKRMPLPLGAVTNSRSMVSVWNLCDLIRRSIEVSSIASGVLMVSDGEDLSTPELIRRLAREMKVSTRLIPLPILVLRFAGMLTGKSAEITRLVGSLQVDISSTRRTLNWTPPLSVDEGLARTVHWYLQNRNTRAY